MTQKSFRERIQWVSAEIRAASFKALLLFLAIASAPTARGAPSAARTEANVPVEITFTAQQPRPDPFNEVTLDVIVTNPAGAALRVPAFWAGDNTWKARFASPIVGTHRWRTECNDVKDAGLQGVNGRVEVVPYYGENPLYKHGSIRVASDKRHLEHADGTPFFWLGDTWWMGLCHRLHWPDEFKQLTADRKAKGFNVVQIVMGLYPDMPPFDPRGANEAGFPWATNYSSIRPEYFDAADKRLNHLVEQGFTPCIVGAWGYFIPLMGVEKAKQHWRNLVARYGAWPVVWCVAGEANLPYYLAKGFPYDDRAQVKSWTEVTRYLRETDSFHRLITIHPTGINRLSARNATDDLSLLDIDMLQTPHGQREAVPPTVRTMQESYADKPVMPVINGEASYEMLMDKIPAEWPRAMFWLCMMNGAAGHTYGANGIWQCNRRGQPHGPSPNGAKGGVGYGKITWDEAMNLAGSRQIGLGKKFLEEFPWSLCQPLPGSVEWADKPTPIAWGDWIWFPEGDPRIDAPVAKRFFRRDFAGPPISSVQSAVLHMAADDKFTVWLNGKRIGDGAGWKSPGRFEVTAALKTGRNILAVRAENAPAPVTLNPAGLIASLEIELTTGAPTIIRSGTEWRVAKTETNGWHEVGFDDSGWAPALATAHHGEGPWGRLEENEPYFVPYALSISDQLRIIYALTARPVLVSGLSRNSKYRFTQFDPVTGERAKAIEITTDADGRFRCLAPAHGHDWVAALESKARSNSRPGLR